MDIQTVAAGVLIFSGSFLIVVAAIGLVRFPDFYSRMHPSGKCDTLGQGLVFLGLIFYEGFTLVSVKMLLIIIFIFIANPTATYALVKAAHVAKLKHWTRQGWK